MSSNIICFLSIYCHDSFSEFLRNSFPTSAGIELLDDNYIKCGNSRYACGSLNSKLESDIYTRLFAHYDRNNCSTLKVPNEYKQEFEIMIEIARNTIDDRIGEKIIKLLEDSLPGGVTDYFCQDVLESLTPNDSLSFEIFRNIKELLKKNFTIDELEFYSESSQIACNLWQDRVREHFNSENGLQSLSTKAVFYLFDNGNINACALVSYFHGHDNLSWTDQLNPLITRLLSEQKNYNDLFKLLDRGKGDLGIVIEHDPDILNPFIPFLKEKGELDLDKSSPKEVNWLLKMKVININTASAYYIKAQKPRWTDISSLVSSLLKDEVQYDNLWNVLSHFNPQWLSLRLESFNEHDWLAFLRYLKDTQRIDIDNQPPHVVNRLQELGIIDLNDAALYFNRKPNVEWDDISSLVSSLLKDKTQYDNLWELLNHFDSQWLSLRLESFNEHHWLAFLRYLKDTQRIDIDNQPPHVVNRLQELGIIDLNDAALYFNRKPNVEWDDISSLVSSLLKDKTQYDNLWELLNHFDSQWLSSILDYINEQDWFEFLLYLKNEQRIDMDNQTPQVVNRLSDIQVIDSDSALDYYLGRQIIRWADIRSLASGLLNDNTKYDKLWQLLKHFDSHWSSSILESIKMDPEWLVFLRYLLSNNRILLEKQSPRVVNFFRMKELISTQSVVEFFQNVESVKWSDISDIIPIYLDSNRYDDLTLLLNKCGREGYPRLFESFDYLALKQYLIHIIHIKNLASNIIEWKWWDNVDNEKRELFLRTVLDNLDGGYMAAEEPLKKYFEAYEKDVSSELYCYLFTKNYYFGFIMSSFKRIVRNLNREGVDNVMKKAGSNQAWSIAQDIINTNAPN